MRQALNQTAPISWCCNIRCGGTCIYGEVYASRKRFEHGRFAGKRAMLSLTVGTNADNYAFNGRSGDIDLLLWPVQFSLAYVGYSVLVPFGAYGVEAGLRYSDPAAIEARLTVCAAVELVSAHTLAPSFQRMLALLQSALVSGWLGASAANAVAVPLKFEEEALR